MNALANLADKNMEHYPTSTPVQPNVDESRKMHAIIWKGKKEVEYVEKPVPIVTDSRDIILQVIYINILFFQ